MAYNKRWNGQISHKKYIVKKHKILKAVAIAANCVWMKNMSLEYAENELPNKRSELISKCRHTDKLLIYHLSPD